MKTLVTITLSKLKENKQKQQLRFSLMLSVNNFPLILIDGMRIKNNKLLFPSYNSPRGQALPLVFAYPEVVEALKRTLQKHLALTSFPEYDTFDCGHCSPSADREAMLLGDEPIVAEFLFNE